MIDVKNIDPEKTVWEIVSEVFKENGITVYPPAVKTDECKAPYVVLKAAGSTQVESYSSRYDYYMILMYVPRNSYTYLARFEKKIHDIIQENLYPMIIPTGYKENDFYDTYIKAHGRSFTVRNVVRDTML